MSKSLNQSVKYWKDFESKFSRSVDECHHLSKSDVKKLAKAAALQGAMMDDILLQHIPTIRRVSTNALLALASDPLRGFQLFKQYLSGFLQLRDNQSFGDYLDGFKHHQADRQFVGVILSPLKTVYGASGPEGCVRITIQWCSFASRIKLDSVDYSEAMLQEYLEDELFLQERDEKTNPVCKMMNIILHEWLAHPFPRPEPWHFHHGPGTVAEIGKVSTSDKYFDLGSDHLLRYVFLDECYEGDLQRTCDVIFVPKSILGWRTISMEPATLMFYQQGVLASFDTWFSSHPVLRRHINLHNADLNADAAREASMGRDYVTIDLSSASDRISWSMIKAVFGGTDIYRYLLAVRSRYARLPDQSTIRLNKHAPMGSAVCFPTMCCLFALVIEAAGRYSGYPDSNFRVYGDDLIVRSELSTTVIDFLEALGFKINKLKSFVSRDCPFRESCGGEYWNGYDVTPLRLPRKFMLCEKRRNAEWIPQYVSLINQAYDYNLRIMRTMLLQDVLALPRSMRPAFTAVGSSDDSSMIISAMPTNHHLSKHEPDESEPYYGYPVYKAGAIQSIGSYHRTMHGHENQEIVRYLEWLRLSCDPRRVIPTITSVSLSDVTIASRTIHVRE